MFHVRVSHIYREGNQVADILANWGIMYRTEFSILQLTCQRPQEVMPK